MNYHIFSIDKAIEHIPGENEVIIRALEPRSVNKELPHKDKYKDVLELYFDDYTEEDWIEMNLQGSNFKLFNKELAKKVRQFFKKNKDANVFVFHCNAGVSRSSALALSFAKMIQNKSMEEEILTNKKYVPNTTVIKYMIETKPSL